MTESPEKKPRIVKLSSLKADRQKEREGDWIPAVDIAPSVRWFVRSTNYAPFRIERDARTAKLARKYGDDPIPDDESAELMGNLAVEHLLLGWEGLDVEYSSEAAAEILTDEAYRSVRYSVYLAATKVGKSDVEFVGTVGKN
ncbi:hypothetical protein [Bradyrhizobium cenepequi]